METKIGCPIGPTDEGFSRDPIEEINQKEEAMETKTKGLTPEVETIFEQVHTMKKDHKIGRNDKCPCGSGKKYKRCCLPSGKYEGYSAI